METAVNPYEELGVPKNATSEQLKRAYRKKAQENHPDKGGDKEKFQRVTAAHKLLSDETRRARYDTTGDASVGPDNRQAEALSALTNLMLHLMDNADTKHVDILVHARAHVDSNIDAVKARKKELSKKMKKREDALKRLTAKAGKDGPLVGMLQHETQKMQAQIDAMDADMDRFKAVLEMLDDYEYQVDVAVPTHDEIVFYTR